MFSELIATNPTEFVTDVSAFEKLVRMQHHSLPDAPSGHNFRSTDLALAFACDGSSETDGEVIFLKVRNTEIKSFR